MRIRRRPARLERHHRDGGEERERVGEDHGAEVGEEGHAQVRPHGQVPKPSTMDRSPGTPGVRRLGRDRRGSEARPHIANTNIAVSMPWHRQPNQAEEAYQDRPDQDRCGHRERSGRSRR